MTPRDHPRLRDDLVFREIEGEWVVYDPTNDRTSLLNASAALILDAADGEHACEDIVAEVAKAYAIAPDRVRADVEATLRQFADLGFLADA